MHYNFSKTKIIKKIICFIMVVLIIAFTPLTAYAEHDDEEWEEEGGWNDDRKEAVWTSMGVSDWQMGSGWVWDDNGMISLSEAFLAETDIDWNNKNNYIVSINDVVEEELEELSEQWKEGKLYGKTIGNCKYDPIKYKSIILLITFYMYESGVRGTLGGGTGVPICNNYFTNSQDTDKYYKNDNYRGNGASVGYESGSELVYNPEDGKLHMYFPEGDPETGQEIGNVYNGQCTYNDDDTCKFFCYSNAGYDICFYNMFFYRGSSVKGTGQSGVRFTSAKSSVKYLFERIVQAEMAFRVYASTRDEGTTTPDIYHSDEYLKRLLHIMIMLGMDTSTFSERCEEAGVDYTLDQAFYEYPLDHNLSNIFDAQSDQSEFESNINKIFGKVNDTLPDIRQWQFLNAGGDDNHNPSFACGAITDWYVACSYNLTHGLFDANAGNAAGSGHSGSDVVDYAKQFLGTPYVWSGQDLSTGVDCSGFTLKIFEHFGVSLPHNAAQQGSYGEEVQYADLQPGDLVVTNGGDHCVIYIGNNQCIHSSNYDYTNNKEYDAQSCTKDNPGPGVQITAMYDESKVVTCRRIIQSANTLDITVVVGQPVTVPEGYGTFTSYMEWSMETNPTAQSVRFRNAVGTNFDSYGLGIVTSGTTVYYVVAMTPMWGDVGDTFDIKFENGSVLKAVKGIGKNVATDNGNDWGHNQGACIIECAVKDGFSNGSGNPFNGTHDEYMSKIATITKTGHINWE